MRFGSYFSMKRSPILVAQDAAFAAHRFGHQNPLHARRPDHPGRMKLHKFHVHQFRAGFVRQAPYRRRCIPRNSK